jgi:hypothetical protein
MTEDLYVYVVDWRRFQHYRDRTPPWIKDYVEQLDDAEYLQLTGARRGLLQDLRRVFASARGRVRGDTRTLSRRLNLHVTSADLEALVHAGFIELLASDALAERLQRDSNLLAERYRSRARGEEEGEGETSTQEVSASPTRSAEAPPSPPPPQGAASPSTAAVANGPRPPGRSEFTCPYEYAEGIPCGQTFRTEGELLAHMQTLGHEEQAEALSERGGF